MNTLSVNKYTVSEVEFIVWLVAGVVVTATLTPAESESLVVPAEFMHKRHNGEFIISSRI